MPLLSAGTANQAEERAKAMPTGTAANATHLQVHRLPTKASFQFNERFRVRIKENAQREQRNSLNVNMNSRIYPIT